MRRPLVYSFKVNNRVVETDKDCKLLRFLRDELHLKGTKDGCSEGACGTCTVIINGKAVKACTKRTSSLKGASIITIEGLTEREQQVYSHCFAVAGAVQCGYCTPGMIMSAKALLDMNNNPSPDQIRKAIKHNICRCTGYVKIEKAIMMASVYFRDNKPIVPSRTEATLSSRFVRVDAIEKALGKGLYVDDLEIPHMIYAKALRSAYPRARVDSIDLSKALSHPDVVRILTAEDVPNNKIGHIKQDWDVLIPITGVTRYIGDAIALVATRSKECLDEVLALIEVRYTVLESITTTTRAMQPDAPHIHEQGNILAVERLQRGDVEKAFSEAAYKVTKTYHTDHTEHAFMEPECAIAMPEHDGLLVYTASQSIFDEQREIANMLQMNHEKIHCRSMLVGGGFGGKEDMSVQHHAALMAWHTQLPVKVRFSRQESINIHPKRHPMEMTVTVSCDKNGYLTAMRSRIIADTGAYASLGQPVLQRACTHAAGPYNYQNIDIEGTAVYTNNVPCGAFRGFGVTQTCFAIESSINALAELVGISGWEIRYRNAIRPGQVLPNGQIGDNSFALDKCLLAVKTAYEKHPRSGIACGYKNCGLGVGVPDVGRCILSVEKGKIHVRTSAACMGQGLATVCTQIVCQTTKIDADLIVCETPDTIRTPDSGTSTASRQTVFTGEATRKAALDLYEELCANNHLLSTLEGKEYYGEYVGITDPMGSKKPYPKSHVAYSFLAQVVILDDNGKVESVSAACDVGTLVNPTAVEGQLEGGVAMGLGYALTEQFPIEEGYPKVRYGTLGLLKATDVPPIEAIFVNSGVPNPEVFGAKGIGELATIPSAPAVQNAYYRFDGKFRTSLPLEHTFYRK